ncbi:MAG: helix-turn-helix domain-containing protein, partial [Candidatus Paceibacterota bacterium]
VYHAHDMPNINDSDYLSEKLNYDYTYLSNVFSEVKGTTIQQYIIKHRVERIKELLLYDELTLTEIAWELNYSSVSHLSNQFKKVTGLTPTYFKELKRKRETYLENL